MAKVVAPAKTLFLSRVDIAGPDECWEWGGAIKSNGYGVLKVGGRKGKMWYAHRLAHVLFRGPIPKGLFVCHKCDNRKCCNPNHLFLGDVVDNQRDMAQKDRSAFGERNSQHKLTEEDVFKIYSLEGVLTLEAIGQMFGISFPHVSNILKGKRWQRQYKKRHQKSR